VEKPTDLPEFSGQITLINSILVMPLLTAATGGVNNPTAAPVIELINKTAWEPIPGGCNFKFSALAAR
jgi:hypothetical protein